MGLCVCVGRCIISQLPCATTNQSHLLFWKWRAAVLTACDYSQWMTATIERALYRLKDKKKRTSCGQQVWVYFKLMAWALARSTPASHRLDRMKCDSVLPGLTVTVLPPSSCRNGGAHRPSVPRPADSRLSPQSTEQGGGRSDGGNQLCVAIKLSFLSPSNGLLVPWFWAAWSCWSMCTAPSLTHSLSLSYLW